MNGSGSKFMPPKVDLIILNFNGLKHLKNCLASLYKNTEYPFHLIIVDNASTDGSQEWLTSFAKNRNNITLHFNEKPDGGFSEGNNTGLKYAKNEFVLLLNNDVLIIERGWLKRLVKEMEQDEQVGIIGTKLVYPSDLIQHAGVSFGYDPSADQMAPFHLGRYFPRNQKEFNIQREVPAVTFACVLIRRQLLKDGLDEAYIKGCYEDTDFCLKVRKQGYKILYVPIELYHYEGATNLAKPKGEWMGQLQKNFQLFLSRWNEWLKEDIKKNVDLYDPKGPVKTYS